MEKEPRKEITEDDFLTTVRKMIVEYLRLIGESKGKPGLLHCYNKEIKRLEAMIYSVENNKKELRYYKSSNGVGFERR